MSATDDGWRTRSTEDWPKEEQERFYHDVGLEPRFAPRAFRPRVLEFWRWLSDHGRVGGDDPYRSECSEP